MMLPFTRRSSLFLMLNLMLMLMIMAHEAEAVDVKLKLQQYGQWSAGGLDALQAADIDRDGQTELIGISKRLKSILWWKRLEGGAAARTGHLVDGAVQGPAAFCVADLDRDGDLDLIAAINGENAIAWWENTAGDGSRWVRHNVATLGGAAAVAVADIDRDGRLDIIGGGDAAICWYRNAAGNGTAWTAATVATGLHGVASVVAADVDRNGILDVIGAVQGDNVIAWWENTQGNGVSWGRHDIATFAASRVVAGDFDRDGWIDIAATAPSWGTVACWGRTGTPPVWTRQVICAGFTGVSDLAASDFDGDGDLDVAAMAPGQEIRWFESSGGATLAWTQHKPAGLAAPAAMAIADLDRDGDLDLAAAATGQGIQWWENRTLHGRVVMRPQAPFAALGNSNTMYFPMSVADLNGDGRLEPYVTLDYNMRWWELAKSGTTSWVEHITTPLAGGNTLTAADIDRDGDLDLAGASVYANYRDYTWYESTTGNGLNWTAHKVATGLREVPRGTPADIDGDGDLDLLTIMPGSSEIQWNENTDGHGGAWTAHMITGSLGVIHATYPADVDGDGDLDVVAYHDQVIEWFEQTRAGTWLHHAVDPAFPNPYYYDNYLSDGTLRAGDIDGDGDLDLVAAGDMSLVWYESQNHGATWVAHPISYQASWQKIDLLDLDRDGNLDIIAEPDIHNSYTRPGMVFFENPGRKDYFWRQYDLIPSATTSSRLRSALGDLNGDGIPDIAGLTYDPSKSARWWAGALAQFDLAATGEAAARFMAGENFPLLRLVLTHNGRPGDSDIRLDRFGVKLESAPGAPLTSTQANALLDTLELYRDNPDAGKRGSFDAADTRVTSVTTLGTPGGVQTFILPRVPAVIAAPGQSVTFFLRAKGAAAPRLASPNQLQATWLASAAQVRSVEDDRILSATGALDVASGLMTTNLTSASLSAADANTSRTFTNNQAMPLLKLALTHPGRPGDPAVELAALKLRFSDANNQALSTAAVNGLIDKIEIYRDGAGGQPGVFDSSDTLIATSDTLALTAGEISLPVPSGKAAAKMNPGESGTFFAVARTTADARDQALKSFYVTLLAQGCTVRTADNRTPVSIIGQDVKSRLLTAMRASGTLTAFDDLSGYTTYSNGRSVYAFHVLVNNQGATGDARLRLTRLSILFEKDPGVPLTTDEVRALVPMLRVYSSNAYALPKAANCLTTLTQLTLNGGVLTIDLPAADPRMLTDPGRSGWYYIQITQGPDVVHLPINRFRMILKQAAGAAQVIDDDNGRPLSLTGSDFTGAFVNRPYPIARVLCSDITPGSTYANSMMLPALCVQLNDIGTYAPPETRMQLEELSFKFEETAGDPLTSAEAQSLFSSLRIYNDAGQSWGQLDSGDQLVTSVTTFSLNNGVLRVPFNAPKPGIPQSFGAYFYVVLATSPNARAATPRQFRITHMGAGSMPRLVNPDDGTTVTVSGSDYSTRMLTVAAPGVYASTSDISPSEPFGENLVFPLFRFNLASYSKGVPLQLCGIRLLLEESANLALSDAHAHALLDGVVIYRDDPVRGTPNVFDPADTLVTSLTLPTLSQGVAQINLAGANPRLTFDYSGTNFFICARTTAAARSAIPNHFRATHMVKNNDDLIRDADYGTTLSLTGYNRVSKTLTAGQSLPAEASGWQWDVLPDPTDIKQYVGQSVVWTGSKILIWGGCDASGTATGVGWVFDPATRHFSPMASSGAPSPRYNHTAVWTGGRMIIYGGQTGDLSHAQCPRDAAAYDPAADCWTPLASDATVASYGRTSHAAVWTGQAMLVWGGYPPGGSSSFISPYLMSYDPATQRWATVPSSLFPSFPTVLGAAFWTGDRLLLWGGQYATYYDAFVASGFGYDPLAGTASRLSTNHGLLARSEFGSLWTGSRMVVLGGHSSSKAYADGAIYDPTTDTWTHIAPQMDSRGQASMVWTGSELIMWGGRRPAGGVIWGNGLHYNPATTSSLATRQDGAPASRYGHKAVWTDPDHGMFVFGGFQENASTSQTYAIYTPNPGPVPPVAEFSADICRLNAPLTVHFTDASVRRPTAWAWDFDGDGQVDSTERNPVHTYTTPGQYTVSLTVTNAYGSSKKTRTNLIEVTTAPPLTDFITSGSTSGLVPLRVSFIDRSLNAPTAWGWDFDNDGRIDSTERNPVHTFDVPGSHTVRLVATNAFGSFETIRRNLVQVDAPAPVASFTMDQYYGLAPLTVKFQDASHDYITSWAWDFDNDGKTDSTLPNPTFVYATPGTYTVRLRVGNIHGTAEIVQYVYVNGAPVAAFDAQTTSGMAPLTVQFINNTKDPANFYWDFNSDGTTDSINMNPVYTFGSPGTYSVSLLVRNGNGQNLLTRHNLIRVNPRTPGKDPLPSSIDLARPTGAEGSALQRIYPKRAFQAIDGQHCIAFGDVNGDGYDDVIMGGASHVRAGTAPSSDINIVYGGPQAGMPGDIDMDGSPVQGRRTCLVAATGDRTAGTVIACGDINGDQYDDIVFGVPGPDPDDPNLPASVYVVYGGKSLSDQTTLTLGGANPPLMTRIIGESAGDLFGSALATGDINGDGCDDIVIGSPHPNPYWDPGKVYVVYGRPGLPGQTLSFHTQGPVNLFGETRIYSAQHDNFGSAVACGDINGDGLADVIVQAPKGGYQSYDGKTYVFFSNANFYGRFIQLPWRDVVPSTDQMTILTMRDDPTYLNNMIMAGPLACEDVNRDGIDDLILSLYRPEVGSAYSVSPGFSKLHVVYGGPGRPGTQLEVATTSTLDGDQVWFSRHVFAERSFSLGDVNGDGFLDLLLDSSDPNPYDYNDYNGLLKIFFGRATPAGLVDVDSAAPDVTISGAKTYYEFGANPTAGADLNRDGFGDLAATTVDRAWTIPDTYRPYYVTMLGSGTPKSVTASAYFRAGDAPRRGVGGRLSPTLRLWAAFSGGEGGPLGGSLLTASIGRQRPAVPNPGIKSSDVASVYWVLTNTRLYGNSATFTFQYLDSEIGSIPEDQLRVVYATASGANFAELPTTVDPLRNTVTASVSGPFRIFTLARAGALPKAPPMTPPAPGKVVITTLPDDAPWSLSNGYRVLNQGRGCAELTLPAGPLTLTWGAWTGYQTPSPQTITGTLAAGGETRFSGIFMPAGTKSDSRQVKLLRYLLGLDTDPTGLDYNGDLKVNVADLVKNMAP